ncbi:MAG TPA: hypothetical protein DGT21_12100 [Armatimonadetes bacterium]|jgi:hypothetical protein|nr:hypothetical protein [Armatimonadota bacterium]
MCGYGIDYVAIMEAHTGAQSGLVQYLMGVLPDVWCARYLEMTDGVGNILEFEDGGFTFLFDFTSALGEDDVAEDRVVAAFGVTFRQASDRDASRIRGYPMSPPQGIDAHYDRGHFISHVAGGSLDVNLFPQTRAVNRGWSETGKLFRKMERYAADRPGTFCFARPVYRDLSCCPAIVEYGVLMDEGALWVNSFPNV